MKALALIRSGRTDESHFILENLKSSNEKLDEATLQAVTMCYKESSNRKFLPSYCIFSLTMISSYLPTNFSVELFSFLVIRKKNTTAKQDFFVNSKLQWLLLKIEWFKDFLLSRFSFTNIHESQDCRGRGREFL